MVTIIIPDHSDYINWDFQMVDWPRDFVFILDQIASNPPEGLEGVIDSDHAGATGYSFGGDISLTLSGVRIDPEYYLAHCEQPPIVAKYGDAEWYHARARSLALGEGYSIDGVPTSLCAGLPVRAGRPLRAVRNDLLRTDGHPFQPLTAQGDDIRALRALVRGRDDLVATRVQLANQLRALLETYSGAAEVFADVDSPIALVFIQRYPTPDAASRLGPKRMAAFCAQHAYCGRRSADELLQRLRQAPSITAGELEMDAKGELASSLARTLSTVVDQIRLLSSRIEHHIAASDDGRILMSFPRAGRICAAQILHVQLYLWSHR